MIYVHDATLRGIIDTQERAPTLQQVTGVKLHKKEGRCEKVPPLKKHVVKKWLFEKVATIER